MKGLKKTTVGILMATLMFSNMQLYPAYGNELDGIAGDVNEQRVEHNDKNIKYQNSGSKENDKNERINIPDINLKKALNEYLGKNENEDITKEELESIKNLLYSTNNKNITNLEGLQYCTNLELIDLSNNQISDISKLSGLTNLRELNLSHNNISDISGLSSLSNLEALFLASNNISDISGLSSLSNLYSIDLSYNNISDISSLLGLTSLIHLNLDTNNISDISGLSSFSSLSTLNLRDNNIKDISVFSKLNKIRELNLTGNKITDITPLENLNLVYSSHNSFGDISLGYNYLDLDDANTIKVIDTLTNKGYYVFFYNQRLTDIKDHWAESTIRDFINKDYINGYSDGTFKPNNDITRAEFVKIVNKVFGFTQKGTVTFNDVKSSDWFYDEIAIAQKAGYINGKSETTFAPQDKITRQEVAVILTNIKNNKDTNYDKINQFTDGYKTSEWAKSSVEGAIEAGYLSGDDKGLLNPTSNITRAEVVTMLSRVN